MMAIVLMLQEYYIPPDPGGEVAFSGYLEVFADLIMAAGAVLAIMAAYRIYQNAQLGDGNLYQGTANLLLGMIFLLLTRTFLFILY